MTVTLDWDLIEKTVAVEHPTWCEKAGTDESCLVYDQDFAVVHSRGGNFLPATSSFSGEPIEICVALEHITKTDGKPGRTNVGLIVPGRHADLDRSQLRLLIAELQHLDAVWDL